MSRDARGPKGTGGEYPSFALNHSLLTLWDMSKKPANNFDVRERLGGAAKTRGVAIIDVDEDTGRSLPADGITNKERRAISVAPFDPDAFVYRSFGTTANPWGTWMPRLTADMDEAQYAPTCRSTMITDNANDMSFGWITDILALVDAPSGGDLIGDGLAYDGAGFLETLYETEYAQATYKRSALALSLHRNKGFIADGEKLAQLSHVLTFVSGGSGTVSAATGQSLRSRSGVELALRGDSAIKFSGGVGRLHMDTPPDIKPDEQEAHLVYLFLHLPGAKDDELNTGNDANADFERMEKVAGKQIIRGFVYLPKPGGGG